MRAQVQYSCTTSKEFGITTEETESLASSLRTFYRECYCGGRSQTIIRLAITQREANAWGRFTFHCAISWDVRIVGVWRLKWQEHCKHLSRQGFLGFFFKKTLESCFSRLVTQRHHLLHLASEHASKEVSLSSPDRDTVEAKSCLNLNLTHFNGWN